MLCCPVLVIVLVQHLLCQGWCRPSGSLTIVSSTACLLFSPSGCRSSHTPRFWCRWVRGAFVLFSLLSGMSHSQVVRAPESQRNFSEVVQADGCRVGAPGRSDWGWWRRADQQPAERGFPPATPLGDVRPEGGPGCPSSRPGGVCLPLMLIDGLHLIWLSIRED